MRVTVNGEQREITSASVDALLSELEYEGTHFAIAVNYDVPAEKPLGRGRCSRAATRSRSSPRGREGDGDERATHSAVIARLDRATQYTAASRFDHRLPGVLDPRLRGDDEWCCRGDRII
jgi:hypothetical protein